MNLAKVILLPKGCDDPAVITETGVKEITSWYREMTQGVAESALRIGALLLKVQSECGRSGQKFTDLFPKDKSEIGQPGKMPFVYRTGSRFMAIAGNEALANRTHVSYLPSDWGAIYELSRLPAPQLIEIIEAGDVTPDMSRKEVVAVVKKARAPQDPAPEKDPVPVTAKRLAKIIESCNEKLAESLDAGIAKKQADALYLMPIIRTAESLLESIRKEFIE